MTLAVKRSCEAAATNHGYRVLLDRLWPRGLKKDALPPDEWIKELAASTTLRQWFGHEPA